MQQLKQLRFEVLIQRIALLVVLFSPPRQLWIGCIFPN